MNKNQRIVLSIFVPIIIFFITLIIANSVGVTATFHFGDISVVNPKPEGMEKLGVGYHTYTYDPLDWEKTWYVWLLCLILICIFEYKLFADKKKKDKEV